MSCVRLKANEKMNEYAMTDEETISKIADTCPRAVSAYIISLSHAGDSRNFTISRDTITNHHYMSWTKFKNDLRALGRIFVLFFVDKGDSVEISLPEIDE